MARLKPQYKNEGSVRSRNDTSIRQTLNRISIKKFSGLARPVFDFADSGEWYLVFEEKVTTTKYISVRVVDTELHSFIAQLFAMRYAKSPLLIKEVSFTEQVLDPDHLESRILSMLE
jgi:hypothetical protein